jgi:hypothetical protein
VIGLRLSVLPLILTILVFSGCQRTAQTVKAPTAIPDVQTIISPNPTCWIYQKMFPATADSYRRQHVKPAEQHLIEKWAGRVPAPERSLVRWIRDPRDSSIYVFVASPQTTKLLTEWQALNTNIAVDTVNCELHAMPGA